MKRRWGVALLLVAALFVLLAFAATRCRVTIPEDADCYFVYPYGDGSQIDSQKLSDTDASYLRELLNGHILYPNISLLGQDQRFVESYYFEFRTEKGTSVKFYIPRSAATDGSFAINMYFYADYDGEIGEKVFNILNQYNIYLVSVR